MNFKRILMTIAVCAAACTSAQGADKPLDKDFISFWSDFKVALQKNDKAALASMTKLPYYDTKGDKKLDRTAFIAQSEKIFPAATRKCLLKQKPVADTNDVCVFCDEDIFIFAKVNGKYKFTDISVND